MPTFGDLKDSYAQLWETAELRPERQAQAHRAAAKVMDGRAHYESVGGQLGIPWYFIGLAHMRESYCNFGTHLHNGDSLRARTYHVPAGRPAQGSPPFAWDDSAVDALMIKGLQNIGEWPIEQVLYQLERFNGFGYRRPGRGNTPYLWADTNHYQAGKFVSDRVYSSNTVDTQDGCAGVLKVLLELDPHIFGVAPAEEAAVLAPKAMEADELIDHSKEAHAEAHDTLKDLSDWYNAKRYVIKSMGLGVPAGVGALWTWLSNPLHLAIVVAGCGLAGLIAVELLQLKQRNAVIGGR